MGKRAVAVLCVIGSMWAVPTSAAGAAAAVCTWGGTPADTTGTVTIHPGLTFTPAAQPLHFVATGRAYCTDGFSGRVTFDGVLQAGSTCAFQVFEGRVQGLPGVARFFGPGVTPVVHEVLYDRNGNIVGSDQPQVLSGAGQGSEITDCNTQKGFTDANFSSVIELYR